MLVSSKVTETFFAAWMPLLPSLEFAKQTPKLETSKDAGF